MECICMYTPVPHDGKSLFEDFIAKLNFLLNGMRWKALFSQCDQKYFQLLYQNQQAPTSTQGFNRI